jgi:hypothetical protein
MITLGRKAQRIVGACQIPSCLVFQFYEELFWCKSKCWIFLGRCCIHLLTIKWVGCYDSDGIGCKLNSCFVFRNVGYSQNSFCFYFKVWLWQRTAHLQNSSLERYCYTGLLGNSPFLGNGSFYVVFRLSCVTVPRQNFFCPAVVCRLYFCVLVCNILSFVTCLLYCSRDLSIASIKMITGWTW